MDKTNPNHVVLCAERNTDGNSSLINSCQFRKLWTDGDGGDWSVEVGTYSTEMVASFNRCINFVMTATDQEFHDNIGQYFDLYSLLDYYCFSYLTCHLDGLAKNILIVTYDGVIWGACLYDMDSIYGVNWDGKSYVAANYQCPEQYQEQFSALWPRIERCFSAELYARYRELRKGALSLSNIVKHVEEIYDVIPDRVFADEKTKWASLPQVNTNTITRFRNYMRDRAAYVDAEMKAIGDRIPCTGIVLGADTLSFTTTDTQTLSAVVSPDNCTDVVTWSVSPSGIVTVDGGVVTPVSNGSCTITATCGSYSDTCAVTVSLPVVECTGITLDKHELAFSSSTSEQPSEETIDITQNVINGSLIRGKWAVNDNGGIFGNVSTNTSDRTTDFIPFTSNNTLTISQPSSKYGCGLVAYDSNKQALACYTTSNIWEAGDTQNGIDIKTLTVNVSTPPADTAYIRISFNLTDLSGVTVIKKSTGTAISSHQLTATVTPENCTQPVVWSVSPEGIVTVDNGLVKAVANGEATITATCGSYSDTCSVTVSGMIGETDIYATAEYAITEPRTFNGTSDYIDTGIKLFDTAKTFTIFLDYATTTPTSNNQATVFHCLHETSPFRGLCMMEFQSNDDIYFIGGQASNQNTYATDMPSNGKYLISFVNGVINNVVTVNGLGNLVYSATNVADNNPYVQISENLLIGCYQNTSGTKGRYWSGTINKFGVWYKQLTSDEINKVFGRNGGGTDISDGYMSYMIQYQSEHECVFALHSASTSTDCQGFECTPSFKGFAFPTSTTNTDTSYMICDSLPTVTDSEKKVNNIPCIAGAYSTPKNYLTVKVLKTNASTTDEFKTYFRENPTYIKIKAKNNVHKYSIDINNIEMLNTSHTSSGYTCGEFILNDLPTTNYTASNVFMSNLGFSDDWRAYDWSYFKIGKWQGQVYVGFQIKNELLETQDLEGIRKYIAKDPNIYYIN